MPLLARVNLRICCDMARKQPKVGWRSGSLKYAICFKVPRGSSALQLGYAPRAISVPTDALMDFAPSRIAWYQTLLYFNGYFVVVWLLTLTNFYFSTLVPTIRLLQQLS